MLYEVITGSVMHRRLRPVENRFVYGVYFLRIPLSRLASMRGPVLSINRWNLLSFHFRDHGARDGSHPLEWIRALLAREGLVITSYSIHYTKLYESFACPKRSSSAFSASSGPRASGVTRSPGRRAAETRAKSSVRSRPPPSG